MDTVDIEPRGDLFAFLDASVGAQGARRLRLHLGRRGVFLQHDGGSAVFCGVGSLFYNSPERGRREMCGQMLSDTKEKEHRFSLCSDYFTITLRYHHRRKYERSKY